MRQQPRTPAKALQSGGFGLPRAEFEVRDGIGEQVADFKFKKHTGIIGLPVQLPIPKCAHRQPRRLRISNELHGSIFTPSRLKRFRFERSQLSHACFAGRRRLSGHPVRPLDSAIRRARLFQPPVTARLRLFEGALP
jgi:hypothetical protein